MPGSSHGEMHFGAHILNYTDTNVQRNILKANPWETQNNSFRHNGQIERNPVTLSTHILSCGEPDVVKMVIDMLFSFPSELFEGVKCEQPSSSNHPCCNFNSFELTNWALDKLTTGSSSVREMIVWFLEFGNELLLCRKFVYDFADAVTTIHGCVRDGDEACLNAAPPLHLSHADLLASCCVELSRVMITFDKEISKFEKILLCRPRGAASHSHSHSHGRDPANSGLLRVSHSISLVKLYRLCYKQKHIVRHYSSLVSTLVSLRQHMLSQADVPASASVSAPSPPGDATVAAALGYHFIAHTECHVRALHLLCSGSLKPVTAPSDSSGNHTNCGTQRALSFQGTSLKFASFPSAMAESGDLLLARVVSTSLYRSLEVTRRGTATATATAGPTSISSRRVLSSLRSSRFARQLFVSNSTISAAVGFREAPLAVAERGGDSAPGNIAAVLNSALNRSTAAFTGYLRAGGSTPSVAKDVVASLPFARGSAVQGRGQTGYRDSAVNRRQRKALLLSRVFGTNHAGAAARPGAGTRAGAGSSAYDIPPPSSSIARPSAAAAVGTRSERGARRLGTKFQLFQHMCPLATQTQALLHNSVQGAIKQHNGEVLSNLVEYYDVDVFLRTVVKDVYWFGDSVELCRCLALFFDSVSVFEAEVALTVAHESATNSLLGIGERSELSLNYDVVCARVSKIYEFFVSDVVVPMNAHYSRLAAQCSQQCHSLVVLQLALPALVVPTREYAERSIMPVDAAESPLEFVLSVCVSRCSVHLYANYPFSVLLGRGAGNRAGVSASGAGHGIGSVGAATSHVETLNAAFQHLLALHMLKTQLEMRWIHANKMGNLQCRSGDGRYTSRLKNKKISAAASVADAKPENLTIPTNQRVTLYLLLQFVNRINCCLLDNIHGNSGSPLWSALGALSRRDLAPGSVPDQAAGSMGTARASLPTSIVELTNMVGTCIRSVENVTSLTHGYNKDTQVIVQYGWRALRSCDDLQRTDDQRNAVFNELYTCLIALHSNLTARHSIRFLRAKGNLSGGIGEDLLAVLPNIS